MNQPPTEETYAAITNREAFAKTRGVTRNAIDQLMAGNTHDCYRPFRDFFKDVCFTRECDPMPFLNDLQGIYRSARVQSRVSVADAFMEQLTKAHDSIEAITKAMSDGELDKRECRQIIALLSETCSSVEALKGAVIDRNNELNQV